jgi:hypothetical protein
MTFNPLNCLKGTDHMKTTNGKLTLALGLLALCLASSAKSQIVSDDFDRATLNTNLWTWSDPDGDDTNSIVGFGTADVVLSFSVSGNEEKDAWESTSTGEINNCPQITQPAPDQDFEVTAKWETVPGPDYGEYGLLVYDPTGTNFLRFDVQGGDTIGGLQGYLLIIQNGNGNTLCNGSWAQSVGPLAIPADGTDNGIAYMRLNRTGDTWTFLLSADGVNWYTVYQPVQQAWTVARVGPYVGSLQVGQGITYNLDYFFNDASPIVYEDGQPPPPAVVMTAPTNGAVVALPTNLVVSAAATDVAGSVTNVAYFEGTNLIGAATASPWSVTWTNPSLGQHSIFAVATDSLGLQGPSPTITFQVVRPNVVAITAPAYDTILTNPASVVLTASATDVAGSITNVSFYDIGFSGGLTLIGAATASPYSVTWNNPSPGWHTLIAQAGDNLGYLATSTNFMLEIYITNGAPFSDDFDHASLNTNLWTWVDPDGDDTNSIVGFGTADVVFSVAVSGNEEKDAWVNNNCAQLLQNAVNQDFEVTAKWETVPGLDDCEYGLLVYDPTGTNFLRFNVQGDAANGLQGYLIIIQNGNGNTLCNGTWAQSVAPLVSPTDGTDNGIAYMRLRRQGDMWTFLVSTDGLNWATVYQPVQQAWTVAQIGPYVGSQQTGQGITYNLDYFFNDASPIVYEDGQPPIPVVSITAPTNGTQVALPGDLVLSASATDVAGSVTNVAYYYDATNLIGSATASPWSYTWTNPVPGQHTLIAVAADSLGLTGSSLPIIIDVAGQGGSLSGSWVVATGGHYDLTSLGTLDWAHWNGTFIDKASGGGLISDVTQIGGGTYGTYNDPSRNVSWSDGTPIESGTNDNYYIWCNGAANSGWTFTVPADTTNRTLHVLVGGPPGADVNITAQLSDNSAFDYSDTETSPPGAGFLNDYALVYKAASASQTLTITETHVNSGSPSCDLDAAWLTEALPGLAIGQSGSDIQLSWPSSLAGYSVEVSTNLANPQWAPVTNGTLQVVGSSNVFTVPIGSSPTSFYRLAQ